MASAKWKVMVMFGIFSGLAAAVAMSVMKPLPALITSALVGAAWGIGERTMAKRRLRPRE